MGHIDIRFLPKTFPWRRVHGEFATGTPSPRAVGTATCIAAHERLTVLRGDPGLTYCVWLLMRLASASRRPDFDVAVRQLGLNPGAASVLEFVAEVDERARHEVARLKLSGPFGDLALAALTSTLAETLGVYTVSFIGTPLGEIQLHFKQYGTPRQLARIVSRFFGAFLSRVLRFYLDKELPLQAGAERVFLSIYQGEVFLDDVDRYARRLAELTAEFSEDSYHLHDWLSDGQISRDEVGAYLAHLLDKLRGALANREAAGEAAA
jgi:hypothetical protein